MSISLLQYINQKSNLYLETVNDTYQITPDISSSEYAEVKSNEFAHMLSNIPPYYADIRKVKEFLADQVAALKNNIQDELFESTLMSIEDLIPMSFIHTAIADPEFKTILTTDYPEVDNNTSEFDIHQLVIDAITSVYNDTQVINELMDNIKIPSAINIGNKEMFNTEWGDTGDFLLNEEPDEVDEYEADSANAVAQLLHAAHYPETALAEALFDDKSMYKSDLFIISIINHLSNSYNNVALLIPINVSLSDLLAYSDYDGPLTLPQKVQNLSFHCYLFGAGSTGIDNGIQLPYDIKLSPEQWSLVPDGIYPYSVGDSIGYDEYNNESIKAYMVDKQITQQTTL